MSPRISSHGYCYLVGASSPFTELKIGYDVHHAIVQFLCDCTIGMLEDDNMLCSCGV